MFYDTEKIANEFTLHVHMFIPLSYTRDHKFYWWDFKTLLRRMRGIVLERVNALVNPQHSMSSDTHPPTKTFQSVLYKAHNS